MNEKGVTLMELIIVIAIVATLSAIVMVSTNGLRQTYAVKAAAREVFGDMQRTRMAAIREGREYAICFSPGDTAFTSYAVVWTGLDGVACNADDQDPDSFDPPSRDHDDWIAKDLSAKYGGITFAENFVSGTSVSFSPTGTSTNGNVTVSGGTMTKRIIVNQYTGNVRIE